MLLTGLSELVIKVPERHQPGWPRSLSQAPTKYRGGTAPGESALERASRREQLWAGPTALSPARCAPSNNLLNYVSLSVPTRQVGVKTVITLLG